MLSNALRWRGLIHCNIMDRLDTQLLNVIVSSHVASSYGGRALTSLCLTCNRFRREIGENESAWRVAFGTDFLEDAKALDDDAIASRFRAAPHPIDLKRVDTHREAWIRWMVYLRTRFPRYVHSNPRFVSLHTRFVFAWSVVKTNVSPEIRGTLRDGCTVREYESFCQTITDCFDFEIKPTSRGALSLFAMLSVHDGQTWQDAFANPSSQAAFRGIFGGFKVYNYFVSMHLMSLEQILHFARIERAQRSNRSDAINVRFVRNFVRPEMRSIAIDLVSGSIKMTIGTGRRRVYLDAYPSVDDSTSVPNLLSWFALFASRLNDGYYRTTKQSFPPSTPAMCVSLVPRATSPTSAPPGSSENLLRALLGARSVVLNRIEASAPRVTLEITRGVEVRASSIFMPEQGGQWTYCIRIRLLSTVGERERGFKTCQLIRRHWVIQAEDEEEPHRVSGNGVIGKFPLLFDNGGFRDDQQTYHGTIRRGMRCDGEFIYQSQTGNIGRYGSFGGELEFVPGSIEDPEGPPFRVQVGTMAMRQATVLY